MYYKCYVSLQTQIHRRNLLFFALHLLFFVGIYTGECKPSPTNNTLAICKFKGWCPVESDLKELYISKYYCVKFGDYNMLNFSNAKPLLPEVEGFTVFIKNNIEFPKFKIKRYKTQLSIRYTSYFSVMDSHLQKVICNHRHHHFVINPTAVKILNLVTHLGSHTSRAMILGFELYLFIYLFNHRRNILDKVNDEVYLKKCRYKVSAEDRFCPIFRLGDIIEQAGANFNDIAIHVNILSFNFKFVLQLLIIFIRVAL